MHYFLVWVILLVLPLTALGQTVFTQNYFQLIEPSFNNSVPSNPIWFNHIFNESTFQQYDPVFNSSLGRWVFAHPGGAEFLVAGPQHLWARPASSLWNFIGVDAGELFRATPQNGDPASRLVFGISTLSLPNGMFVGDTVTISLSLAGTGSPGHFSLYSNDDQFNNALGVLGTVYLSSFDNITSFTRQTGTLNNFNLAFSDFGTYQLDFQFSGQRESNQGGGTVFSEIYRYTFTIAAVPEPAVWAVLGLTFSGFFAAFWHFRRRNRRIMDAALDAVAE